jgi:hypothetical protein
MPDGDGDVPSAMHYYNSGFKEALKKVSEACTKNNRLC